MKYVALFLLATSLSACASFAPKNGELVETTYEENRTASVLGRYLTNQLMHTKIDLEFLSQQQLDLGFSNELKAASADLFSKNGSYDYIGQAFVPAKLNISNANDANNYLIQLYKSRIEHVAEQFNSKAKCLYGCNTQHSIYHIKLRRPENAGNDVYHTDLYFAVNLEDVKKNPPNSYASILLGYPVAWGTPNGNSASVFLYSASEYGRNNPKVVRHRGGFVTIEGVSGFIIRQNLGIRIMATLMRHEGMIWGSKVPHPKALFIDGNEYRFNDTNSSSFVKFKVTDQLTLENRPHLGK